MTPALETDSYNALPRVVDPDAVLAAIRRAKVPGRAFATNLFLAPDAIRAAVAAAPWHMAESQGSVCFLQPEDDFFRLHFATSNWESLTELLGRCHTPHGPCVADLLGREADLAPGLATFQKAGFAMHATFQRMVCVQPLAEPTKHVHQVERATAAQATELHETICANFDTYAEHLPSLEEVISAISRDEVLEVRRDGALAALLHFETIGVTTTLRYWLVREPYRGQGLAGALMRAYFAATPCTRRHILWVQTTNTRAIEAYRHYGYSPDSMRDFVLMR